MSKASRALKLLEQDDMVDQPSDGVDLPGDTKPSDEQPIDSHPDSSDLQDLSQPAGMAEALDGMGDMCDRYMNEEDTACFTPQTDDDKNVVMEARGMVRKAGHMMRGLKSESCESKKRKK
jgi:hypothetical protein